MREQTKKESVQKPSRFPTEKRTQFRGGTSAPYWICKTEQPKSNQQSTYTHTHTPEAWQHLAG